MTLFDDDGIQHYHEFIDTVQEDEKLLLKFHCDRYDRSFTVTTDQTYTISLEAPDNGRTYLIISYCPLCNKKIQTQAGEMRSSLSRQTLQSIIDKGRFV